MAIIIKSSRTPRPLKEGEFDAVITELKESYLQITGKSLPNPPPEFLERVKDFGGECCLSKSTWDFGAIDSFNFGTGYSVIATAVMGYVAEHHEGFLAEDNPWSLLLNPESNLMKYFYVADGPLRANARASVEVIKPFPDTEEHAEGFACRGLEDLGGSLEGFLLSYGTKNLLAYLAEWIEHEYSPCLVVDFLSYEQQMNSVAMQQSGQELLDGMNDTLVKHNLPVAELTSELRSRLQRFCGRYESFEARYAVFVTWAIAMDGLIWVQTGGISHVLAAFLAAKTLKKAERRARKV